MDIRKRNQGSQMALLLNQEPPKPLRNHQRSNIESMRALQGKKHDEKVQAWQQKIDDATHWKLKQFENVKPRLMAPSSNTQEFNEKKVFLRKNTPKDRTISKENVKLANTPTTPPETVTPATPSQERKPTVPRADDFAPRRQSPVSRNFIRENSSAAIKKARLPSPEPLSKSFDKRDDGVPTYIGTIKNKLEEEKRKKSVHVESVPAGFRMLDEDERLETLAQLKIKHAEAESAYMRLPLKIETEGQKRRQASLQEQIAEFDRLRKMFDRPKVLVEIAPKVEAVKTH